MYIFEDMLLMALEDNNLKAWPSVAHKKVCEFLLLCNSNINSRSILSESAKIILDLPEDRVKTLTYNEAWSLGIPLPSNLT